MSSVKRGGRAETQMGRNLNFNAQVIRGIVVSPQRPPRHKTPSHLAHLDTQAVLPLLGVTATHTRDHVEILYWFKTKKVTRSINTYINVNQTSRVHNDHKTAHRPMATPMSTSSTVCCPLINPNPNPPYFPVVDAEVDFEFIGVAHQRLGV